MNLDTEYKKSKSPTFMLLFVMSILILFMGCTWSPERDNPADPGSENFRNEGLIRIQVKANNGAPLPDASVFLDSADIGVRTDNLGEAEIRANLGLNHVSVDVDGYVPAVESVEVLYGERSNIVFNLDGLPSIDSIRIYTGLEHRTDTTFDHYFIIDAYVSHPDNAVERVTYHDPVGDVEDIDTLLLETDDGLYTVLQDFGTTPDDGELRVLSRLGKIFVVTATDDAGEIAQDSIIFEQYFRYDGLRDDFGGDAPILIETQDLILSWDPASVDFIPLQYRSVLKDEDNIEVISDTTFYVVPDTLTTEQIELYLPHPISVGDNFNWRLMLYDMNGNWVRTPNKPVVIFI